MAPRSRRRYSVCVVWKCSPDVHVEWREREIVVLYGEGVDREEREWEGGEMGMWYTIASRPWRMMGRVPDGWGSRIWGEGRGVLFGLWADLLARFRILSAVCIV
jgi:hypothetical protein